MKRVRCFAKFLVMFFVGVFVLSGCSSRISSLSLGGSPQQDVVQNRLSQPNLDRLPQAQKLNTFQLSSDAYNDVVGHLAQTTIKRGDTLSEIAQRYDIGYEDLMRANPNLDPQNLQVGQKILIPTMYILPPPDKRTGIVINIPELRLYDFTQDDKVMIFPVALGRQGWRTPVADTYVFRKEEKPTWHPPKSIRQHYQEKYGQELPRSIGPGPNNPLGKYAVYLHKSGYLIHGTNKPSSVGHFVSSGCIRMYAEDIQQVYQHVQQGTPVHIIHSTNKAGWLDDALYLSAYQPVEHDDALYQIHHKSLAEVISAAKKRRQQPIWISHGKKRKVKDLGYGIPTEIGYVLSS